METREFKSLGLIPFIAYSSLTLGSGETTLSTIDLTDDQVQYCGFDENATTVAISNVSDLIEEIDSNNNGGLHDRIQYVIRDDLTIDRTLPIYHDASFCGLKADTKINPEARPFNEGNTTTKPTLTFSGDFSRNRTIGHGYYHLKVGILTLHNVQFRHLRMVVGDATNMDGLVSSGCADGSFNYKCFDNDEGYNEHGSIFSADDISLIDATGERSFLFSADLSILDIRNSLFRFRHQTDTNSVAIRISEANMFDIENIRVVNTGNPGEHAAAISWRRLPRKISSNIAPHSSINYYRLSKVDVRANKRMNLIGVFIEDINQATREDFDYTTDLSSGNRFSAGIKYPFYFGHCDQSFGRCNGKTNTVNSTQVYDLSPSDNTTIPNSWANDIRQDGQYSFGFPTTGDIVFKFHTIAQPDCDYTNSTF